MKSVRQLLAALLCVQAVPAPLHAQAKALPRVARIGPSSAVVHAPCAAAFMARPPDDLDAALAAIAAVRPKALPMIRDAVFSGQRDRIAAWALTQHVPTFAGQSELVQAGVLMAYAAPLSDACRRLAHYVKKILDGAKPADLPVEQPTRFEWKINLKTAIALGLTTSQSLLVHANWVIQ